MGQGAPSARRSRRVSSRKIRVVVEARSSRAQQVGDDGVFLQYGAFRIKSVATGTQREDCLVVGATSTRSTRSAEPQRRPSSRAGSGVVRSSASSGRAESSHCLKARGPPSPCAVQARPRRPS